MGFQRRGCPGALPRGFTASRGLPRDAAGEEEPEPVAPPCLRVVAPQALSTKIECTKSESAKIDPAIAANGSPLPSAEPRVPELAGEREEEPIPLDEVAQSWEEPAPDGVEDESLDPELEAFLRGNAVKRRAAGDWLIFRPV